MLKKTIIFFGEGEIEGFPSASLRHCALLLLLAMGPETGIERADLAKAMWGGRRNKQNGEPVKARINLSRYLSDLRIDGKLRAFLPSGEKGNFEELPVWLKRYAEVTSDEEPNRTVQMFLDIDILNFDILLSEGQKEAAIQLYRGRLLAGLEKGKDDIPAIQTEREIRHNNYLKAVREIAFTQLQEENINNAVDTVCSELVNKFPNDPHLHLLLGELLKDGGYKSDALVVAQKHIDYARTTAVEPSTEVVLLREALGNEAKDPSKIFEGSEQFEKFLGKRSKGNLLISLPADSNTKEVNDEPILSEQQGNKEAEDNKVHQQAPELEEVPISAGNSDTVEAEQQKKMKNEKSITELLGDFPAFGPYISRPEMEKQVLDCFQSPGNPYRIVTLHGFGGMGKSRLAMECALRLTPFFDGRVYRVNLDEIPDAMLTEGEALAKYLEAAIGRVFKLEGENLTQPSLLLLDTYEAVKSPESDSFLTQIVNSKTKVHLLLTGRKAIANSTIEKKIAVEGMKIDQAREMFLTLIKNNREVESLALNQAEEDAIEPILTLIDYIPLAIELVAAQTDGQSLVELRKGLENTTLGDETSLTKDQFPGGQTNRHRSLLLSLQYSFQRLSPEAQSLFTCLGIFTGDFSAEAVKAVAHDEKVTTLLKELVRASLLHFYVDRNGYSRYHLLRPTRDYARLKMEAIDVEKVRLLRTHHAQYYKFLMPDGQAGFEGIGQEEKLALMEAEYSNLCDALEFCINNRNLIIDSANARMTAEKAAIQMADDMTFFWYVRGRMQEGRRWLARVMEFPDEPETRAAWVRVAEVYGSMMYNQGEFERAIVCFQEILDRLNLEFPESEDPSIFNRINRQRASAHLSMANTLWEVSRLDRAELHWQKSIDLYEEVIDTTVGVDVGYCKIECCSAKANLASAKDDSQAAFQAFSERAEYCRGKNERALASTLSYIVWLPESIVGLEHLIEHTLVCYSIWWKHKNELGMTRGLECAARLANLSGKNEDAARFLGAASFSREEIACPHLPTQKVSYNKLVKNVSEQLGSTSFTQKYEEGRRLALLAAFQEAWQGMKALAEQDSPPSR